MGFKINGSELNVFIRLGIKQVARSTDRCNETKYPVAI